jgi:TonB family protein
MLMFDPAMLRNLVAFVGQTTVIIAAALVLLRLLRIESPSIRYGALRMLVVICLLLPFVQPRLAVSAGASESGDAPTLSSPAAAQRAPGRGAAATPVENAVPWTTVAFAVLIGGILVRAGWTALGLVRLRGLRHTGECATPLPDSELQTWIATRATVRYVKGLGQPVTFGLRHPVVLLPHRLRTMPPHVQRAVLAHELWHVQRRDWAWTVSEEILRAGLWFHPGMWILLSEIQSAREQVVDELTVLVTGSRRNYLDALLAFAGEPPLLAAAAFARRRQLVQRMVLISKESVMSSRRIVASGALFCAALTVTGWHALQAMPLTDTVQNPRDPIIRQPAAPQPARQRPVMDEPSLLQAIQADPSPANYMRLAVFYWEKAFKDHTLTPAEKATMLMLGVNATDSALAQDAEYVDALIYKNIMLRMQANDSADTDEQKRLLTEADRLRNKAIELRKANPQPTPSVLPAGMPPPPPPPPPPGPPITVDGQAAVRVGGGIKPPQKVYNVNPVYPPLAQASRVQGVVIVEAVIDATGRVREVRVLRSIPMLDAAAVEAVRQWEFQPTLLNGVPVPVILTSTVSFTLQ